jgi:CO/xanthine dehydrogenase Mo-binding subunit
MKDGVKSDGTVLAREMTVIGNGGAYSSYVPLILRNAAFALSTYRIPNLRWDAYGVYTNEPVSGPVRGFGTPEALWAIEQQMDIIAGKIGMDPVDFRKKHIVREGEKNIRGEITHSIAARECLEKVAEWIEWGKPSETSSNSIRNGKGIALGNKYSTVGRASEVTIKIHDDGTIELCHGTEEVGQGANTVLSQIAAEEFNVPIEKVQVVWGDTHRTPYDYGATASRTTYSTGNAVRLACQNAKHQILEMAVTKLEAALQDLEIRDGQVYVKGSPEKAIMISDLFLPDGEGCLAEESELIGKATFVKTGSYEDPETGQGERLAAFYTYGAQAAEVAVDVETGLVKVLKFCSAFDMGQPINPKLCEGQMEGGAGMGIGSALYEEILTDKGSVLNPNFTDHRLPTTGEVPAGNNMQSIIVTSPQRDGPFGAKGIGEGTTGPTAPAIANAIYDAVGVRIRDLPITSEKVLNGIKRSKKFQLTLNSK